MLREPVQKTVGAVAAAIKVNSKASCLWLKSRMASASIQNSGRATY